MIISSLPSQPGFHIVDVNAHLDELFKLDCDIFNAPPILAPFDKPEELLNHLTVSHQTTTVIYNNEKGELVGYMSYQEKLEIPNTAELVNIGILPSYRGQGYGDKFMNYYLDLFKNMKSRLVAHPENESAKKLYEKHGFLPVKILKDYYGVGEHRLLYFRPQI
jgi:ribosomal protein S18 acetylase RimI-like enzyme